LDFTRFAAVTFKRVVCGPGGGCGERLVRPALSRTSVRPR